MTVDVQFLSFRPMLGYGTTEMRCVQPARFLNAAGLTAQADYLLAAPTTQCRVLILHRVRYDSLTEKIMSLARSRGAVVVFDIDDFVTENPGDEVFSRSIERTMRLADVVTVSTSFLRDRVASFHQDCRILRNKLSQDLLRLGADAASNVTQADRYTTIGYFSGSAHHDADFAMIAPQLLRLMHANPDVRLVVGGKLQVDPGFHTLGDRFRIEPFRPYEEFIGLLGGIDINLAPLDTTSDFANARSELKFIEASAFGVPTVASPSPAFSEAITDTKTGFLCNRDDWFDLLSRLVSDTALRYSVGEASRMEVTEKYGPEAGKHEWMDLFASLTSDRRPENQAWHSNFYLWADVAGRAKLRTIRRRLKSIYGN